MRYLFLLLPLALSAQITRIEPTHMQAVIDYTAPSAAACTIAINPANPDVDGTLFSGSTNDLARGSTVSATALHRTLVIGARSVGVATNGRRYSRALANETYYTVTICGTMTASFVTHAPPKGAITPEAPIGWPTIDPTNPGPYIDPLTGGLFRLFDRSGDAGANSNSTLPFGAVTGGTGWTNLQSVATAGASFATTTNTNSVVLYPDPSVIGSFFYSGWVPYRIIEDQAGYVTAGGDSATAADRQYALCLTVDDGATCLGNEITQTAAQGTASQIITPSSFPSAMFSGWGSPLVTREMMPSFSGFYGGSVTCTAGSCTISGAGYTTRLWQPSLTRIRIAGSSPTCTNNICTVSARSSSTAFTTAESLTISSAQFYTLSLGIRLRKLNANGTLTVSAGYRAAGRQAGGLRAESNICSRLTFTTGDGKSARLCALQLNNSGSVSLYALTDDGDARYLASGQTGRLCCAATAPSTLANSVNLLADFDPTDPKAFWIIMNDNAGNRKLWKVQYTGTGSRLDYGYAGSPGGDFPNGVDDLLTYTAVADITSALAAQAHYSTATYGGASAFKFASAIAGSGDLIGMSNAYQGGLQDAGACWVMALSKSTGNIVSLVHTLDGWDGTKYVDDLRGGTCHSWSGIQYPTGTFVASQNHIRSNSAQRNSGPFVLPMTGLLRSGVYSTNTALPYPTDATYDRACPGTISPTYQALGATGNNCLTVKLSGTNYVSIAPGPADVVSVRLGDVLSDYDLSVALSPSDPVRGDLDIEQFRVVQGPTSIGGGEFSMVIQRLAYNDYCVPAAGTEMRFRHLTGWRPYLKPGPLMGCGATLVFATDNLSTWYPTARDAGVAHWGVGQPFSGLLRWVTSIGLSDGSFADLATPNWKPKTSFLTSGFAGTTASNVPIQGYPDAGNYDASLRDRRAIVDTHSYLPGAGCNVETGCLLASGYGQTLQAGTTSVYRLQILGTGTYKRGALIVWAGRKMLTEKSSSTLGSTLTDSDPWQFCFALRAGECRVGSSAGELFAVVPRADITSTCMTGDSSLMSPCAMWAHPYGGFMVRRDAVDGDTNANGAGLQKIIWANGAHPWGYAKLQYVPNGKWAIGHAGSWSDQSTHAILVRVPSDSSDGVDRSGFQQISFTGRRVRFGYNPQFHCTPRAEVCEATATSLNNSTPFGFEYEGLASAPANSRIVVPALAGRVLYVSVDGGPTMVVVQ